MKKLTTIIAMLLLLSMPAHRSQAQIPIIDLITGAIKKAIKAMDLQVQRQQNKVIWMQNAQKVMENKMSKLKLDEISGWVEKQRKLYDDYFKELWKVKAILSTYSKVKEIIGRQLRLVEEYKHTWNLLRQDDNFSPNELDEMYRVYSGILDESVKNMDQLLLVTNSFQTQMTDGQRLELIQATGVRIEKNLSDLRSFNNRNIGLSLSRAESRGEIQFLRKWYGLQ